MAYFAEIDKDIDPILKFLEPNPNLPDELREIAEQFAALAVEMFSSSPRNAERTMGFRKLLEAKKALANIKAA